MAGVPWFCSCVAAAAPPPPPLLLQLATSQQHVHPPIINPSTRHRLVPCTHQIAFGSGFKCNSAVWRALRNVNDRHEAWLEDGRSNGSSPKA